MRQDGSFSFAMVRMYEEGVGKGFCCGFIGKFGFVFLFYPFLLTEVRKNGNNMPCLGVYFADKIKGLCSDRRGNQGMILSTNRCDPLFAAFINGGCHAATDYLGCRSFLRL